MDDCLDLHDPPILCFTSRPAKRASLTVKRSLAMETSSSEYLKVIQSRWRKVTYGGMQSGFDDNHTDESFLEGIVMNASVVKRDTMKVMLDSISVSQYICIVALVVFTWICTLRSTISDSSLLCLDANLLGLGFLALLFTEEMIFTALLLRYLMNVAFFTTGLYVLAPIYQTLTRSISSDSIWAVTGSLLLIHLFLHDYTGSAIGAPGVPQNPNLAGFISLNSSIVASVFVASRLPSSRHVFAMMLFSLQIFLFAPLVACCMKRYSLKLHLWVSVGVMAAALVFMYELHQLVFVLLLGLLVLVNLVCPYWLVKHQEYKFEINGPWDEAKLCFDIND